MPESVFGVQICNNWIWGFGNCSLAPVFREGLGLVGSTTLPLPGPQAYTPILS